MDKQPVRKHVTTPEAPTEVNPLDVPVKITNDAPVAIGRVVRRGRFTPKNVPGERVSLPAKQGVWLSQQGLLRLEIASVKPSDLKAAGGVEAWLAANPSKDKMSKAVRAKLEPIPGKDKVDLAKPWDFIEID